MTQEFPKTAVESKTPLDRLRVVLVSPKFPGNLGMTARTMKNCGLSDLRLVAPRAELNREAYLLALAGSELLDGARFHDTLLEAVADCGLVIGTTRRRGSLRRNHLSPEEAADMMRQTLVVNRAALVLGSEDNGLSNQDLELCHWIVSMHTGSDFESFNLSHAAAILLYLFNRAVIEDPAGPKKLASAQNLEHMFSDISRFLLETGFIHEQDPKRMTVAVRKILQRSGLSEREVRILRGIMRQARWRIQNPTAPLDPRDTPQNLKKKKSDQKGQP